jgi:hypothetical protein
MAKLTRYSSFEELKSAPVENPLTPAKLDRVYAELEEFIKLLRDSIAARKKAEAIDLYTTGRQPSEQDFARISEWIKQDKQKQAARKSKVTTGTKPLAQRATAKSKA